VDAAACGGSETEVLHDGGQRIGAIAPVGVVDVGVGVVVVAAPLGFSTTGVAAQYDPVGDRTDKQVFGGA
jgi:hypothetical protein